MFISHKSNTIQHIHETEWQCRMLSKGLSKSEYWAWEASITSGNPPVITYPSEDFTIVECTDENVQARLVELNDYIDRKPEGTTYNIKYYTSKRDGSHFVGDDSAKDARILADEWTRIRNNRNRLLADCDWTQASDSPLSSSKKTEWGTYRTSLRNIPADQSSKTTYADIEWPAKP